MVGEPQNRHHFVATALLAVFLVGGLTCLVIAATLYARELDRVVVLAFPLGFWLLAQGTMILAIGGAFFFAARQERLDRFHGVNEDV